MKHIEKISITNARRFGEEIKIDFGAGATIILAPNGTGKTTIFEAIELALTGSIKRLEKFPNAFIRDGFSEVHVRLDFSERKYCDVKYLKDGVYVKEGNYIDLFGAENNVSVPYLLRLTHFLEQRDKEWFVEKDYKGAGELLRQLPLGKDIQQIISKKMSFMKIIGSFATNAKNELIFAKKQLSEFEELIIKRDSLATMIALTPLEEIVSKLQPISRLSNYIGYNDKFNVTLVSLYFDKVKVSLKQESDRNTALAKRLNALNHQVQLYISNEDLLRDKQKNILEHTRIITEILPIIDQNKKNMKDAKAKLLSIKNDINKLNLYKKKFEELEKIRAHTNNAIECLNKNEKDLKELIESHAKTVGHLEKKERIREKYKLANEKIEEERNNLAQMNLKRDFQIQWSMLSEVNHEIIEKYIPEIEKKKEVCLKLKSDLDRSVSEAEKTYLNKKNALSALNSASTAIQNAVTNIRKYLAENQRKCPVCQADYEPGDLIKRIEVSLHKINPSIPLAIEEEKKALAAFEAAKENQNKKQKNLFEVEADLNTVRYKLEANQKKISEQILPQFPGLATPNEANIFIEEQIIRMESQIEKLEVNIGQLEPEAAIEDLENAKLKKCEEDRYLKELNFNNEELQNEIAVGMADIKIINEFLIGTERRTVPDDISILLKSEQEKADQIKTLEEELSKFEADFREHQDSVLSEKRSISKIKSSQEGIEMEWKQTGLEGQPNEDVLKSKQEAISEIIYQMEDANSKLNIIERELVSWRTAEKFQDAENEVKSQIGNNSESAYLEILKTSVVVKSEMVCNIQQKKGAADLFFSNVISESKKIEEQLNSINEPWKRLLKRIVVNPLISTAPLLENSTVRNSPIAKISANINNESIDIANIASEAQLTDLQLSLMLSMGNKYRWTPWKALLLDDPTQHHDLVHASSVFDVLRDYIFDLEYQVMMSTHDSVQAKFFQRKLQNDGVPCKIYQLVARRDGVTAERLA